MGSKQASVTLFTTLTQKRTAKYEAGIRNAKIITKKHCECFRHKIQGGIFPNIFLKGLLENMTSDLDTEVIVKVTER